MSDDVETIGQLESATDNSFSVQNWTWGHGVGSGTNDEHLQPVSIEGAIEAGSSMWSETSGHSQDYGDGAGYSSHNDDSIAPTASTGSHRKGKRPQERSLRSLSADSDKGIPKFTTNRTLNLLHTFSDSTSNDGVVKATYNVWRDPIPRINTYTRTIPVKGILRPPREKFPENPAPIREGVASLKLNKKGRVPPGARWTKISRKLVNPEALELGKERYEAREDFVIVLRVLSSDEVQSYADVTQRIRAARKELENDEAAGRRRARGERHERHKREGQESFRDSSSDSEAEKGIQDKLDHNSSTLTPPSKTSQWDQTPIGLNSFGGSDFMPVPSILPSPEILHILKGASILAKTKYETEIEDTKQQSNLSPIHQRAPTIEKLVALLLDDDVIKSLCIDALSTVAHERFERNLRRLLKDFAVGLRREAESKQERHAAHFVRLRARNSAYMICSTLSKKKAQKVDDIDPDIENLSEESDSDRSDDEVDYLQQLERFIKASKALEILRENLYAFVYSAEHISHFGGVHGQEKGRECPKTIHSANESQCLNPLEPADWGSDTDDRGRQRERPSSKATRDTGPGYMDTTGKLPISRSIVSSFDTNTVAKDYGSDGYGYTNPQDLVRHDLFLARENVPVLPQQVTKRYRCYSADSTTRVLNGKSLIKGLEIVELPSRSQQQANIRRPLSTSRVEVLKTQIVREIPTTRVDHSIDKSKESLAILDEPVVHPKAIQTGRNMWGFALQTAIRTKMRELLNGNQQAVPKGKARIEWKCKCGHTITDDFTELQPGAADRLRQTLSRSTTNLPVSSNSSSLSNFSRAFSSGLQSLRGLLTFSKDKDLESDLPIHELRSPSNPTDHERSQPETPATPSMESAYLPVCYDQGRYATQLLQLDLTILEADSDKALFQILRKSYHDLRPSWRSWISLRTLESIRFVHFEMYKSELVDVRKQDDVPPPEDIDYRYKPAPPEIIPPVGSKYLMHVFQHPDCAEEESLCLSRFPKKLKERLRCRGGIKPGWGLQYEDGLDIKKLWITLFVVFGLGSLTIGISWAILKHSIQDAFAIAAYLLAFATVTVGTVRALLVM
ncbi:uncharacterized protein BP5553_04658 [Venustampulla echinocandica]|uniref:DUF8035 domain-containing protein n=1 Tax=Venustampulla echinocandica TaxID=2656787 RepID=A0A370TNX7_9HELO|nr:uncharacterized protein BP5553_04658 [Venustampulla echinocandica]RDL37225.1 hypothetical protein BP5553_04658 [Venustampulla echinocandica]